MHGRIITIVGGTGFLGQYVVRELAKAGYRLRIISRDPQGAMLLKTAGDLGQITLTYGDLRKPETIAPQLAGSFAVINLSGILFEKWGQKFTQLHALGPEKLAQAAYAQGVERFIHISALGVDKATDSLYARSKLQGERAVQAAFPRATILRPSVVFGPEDNFLNLFARMMMIAPVLPLLIGGGHTKFQPVFAGDVARAVASALEKDEALGVVYELGGPEVFSFRQILEYIRTQTGRATRLVSLPFGAASFFAAFAELSPFRPLLTRDQVKLLQYDNVVSTRQSGLYDLGVAPTALEVIAPDYLARYRKGGKFALSTETA